MNPESKENVSDFMKIINDLEDSEIKQVEEDLDSLWKPREE